MPNASFADARIALGLGDPGGVSPLTGGEQSQFTDRWYDSIPSMYQQADGEDTTTATGWPLYALMDAVASVVDNATVIADRIAAGALTSASLADDAWIPWLAQAAGVAGVSLAEKRARLANLAAAEALGSRAYLTLMVQEYLTGTRSASVTSSPPWVIRVRVRADELGSVGGTTAGLAAALYATGRVPTGFVLDVQTDQETWAQLALVMPTWSPGEGSTWARIQSMGLAGAGSAYGGVVWVGSAAGHSGP